MGWVWDPGGDGEERRRQKVEHNTGISWTPKLTQTDISIFSHLATSLARPGTPHHTQNYTTSTSPVNVICIECPLGGTAS